MMKPRVLIPMLLCMTCVQHPAQAQSMGRLFTTPDERAMLERERHAMATAPRQPATASVATARPVAREQVLVINGVVRRGGSGRETVWVNSVPHSANASAAGGAVQFDGRTAGQVGVTLRSGKSVIVKVGQTIDAVSGSVRDDY